MHDGSVWVSVAGGTTRGALPAANCAPVESGGEKPDVILASDLPLQGPTLAPTLAAAVRFVLRSHRFRAGRFVVGYQSCDDSTARTQGSDFFKCASNARAFSSDERLVAVVGPYDSSCAQIEIPVTNRSPSGPLAILSPANTASEPDPRGARSRGRPTRDPVPHRGSELLQARISRRSRRSRPCSAREAARSAPRLRPHRRQRLRRRTFSRFRKCCPAPWRDRARVRNMEWLRRRFQAPLGEHRPREGEGRTPRRIQLRRQATWFGHFGVDSVLG